MASDSIPRPTLAGYSFAVPPGLEAGWRVLTGYKPESAVFCPEKVIPDAHCKSA